MANVYIKSAIWLSSFGGVAYILQLITAPSEEKLEKIRASVPGSYLTEEEKKKVLFMKRLKEAANEPPVYMPKRDQ